MSKDSYMEKRMKENYENRTRFFLPRRTYMLIRVDGKRFSKLTKKLNKPFDHGFTDDMIETAKYLCQNIQGSNFAYTQSDEISLLITDFDNINSQMLFDGNIQKIVSVIASMATAKFNSLRAKRGYDSMAQFDGRVFIIPDPIEVFNYFVWRQKDCERNSVSMASRSYFSHKEIKGKNSSQQQDMLMEKGINWNDYDVKFKRGTIIEKEYYKKPKQNEDVYVIRSRWIASNPPVFTQDKNFIWNQIPLYKNKNHE